MVEQQFTSEWSGRGWAHRWRGFGKDGEELVSFMHGEAAKINKAWKDEYSVSDGKLLGFENYKRVVGKIGHYSQEVVCMAWSWARSDELSLKDKGRRIFFQHYLNSALTAIESLDDRYGMVLDKDELIGRANAEILDALNEDSEPTGFTNKTINQKLRYVGASLISEEWHAPTQLIYERTIFPILEEVAQGELDLQEIAKKHKIGLVGLMRLMKPTPRLVSEEDEGGVKRIKEVRTYPNPQTLEPDDLLTEVETFKELMKIINTLKNPRDIDVIKKRNGIGEDAVYGLVDEAPRTLDEIAKEFEVTRERIRQYEARAYRIIRGLYRRQNPTPASEDKLEPQSSDLVEKLLFYDLPKYKERSSWLIVLAVAEERLRNLMTQKYGENMVSSLIRASKNGRLNFENFPEFEGLKRISEIREAVKKGSFNPK